MNTEENPYGLEPWQLEMNKREKEAHVQPTEKGSSPYKPYGIPTDDWMEFNKYLNELGFFLRNIAPNGDGFVYERGKDLIVCKRRAVKIQEPTTIWIHLDKEADIGRIEMGLKECLLFIKKQKCLKTK